MSHSNRNFAIAYVLLVALPIAGLVGVLRSGRSLQAPTSVDGTWSMQAGTIKGAVSPCISALAFDPDTAVTISQSGRNFAINAGKAGGNGVIDGTTLQASLNPAKGVVANCGNDGSLALNANIDPKANPRMMSGVLSVAGCPSCGSTEFRAVKQGPAQRKGTQ